MDQLVINPPVQQASGLRYSESTWCLYSLSPLSLVLKRYNVTVSYTAWIRGCGRTSVLGSVVGVTGRKGLTRLDGSLLLRPWGDAVSLAGT